MTPLWGRMWKVEGRMYGENREYPQVAHLLVPVGIMVVGAVLAVTLDPIWWVLVIGLAGRFVYLLYLLNQRRHRQEEERSTVAP